MKIKKKIFIFFWGVGVGSGVSGWEGQCGCERRIEVFCEIIIWKAQGVPQ